MDHLVANVQENIESNFSENMLPKNCIPKKARVNQNSSSSNNLKKKTSSVQTRDTNFFYITDDECYIKTNGEISKKVRDNYQRAVNYINGWNNLMNEFLKRKRKDEKSNAKVDFCNSIKKVQFTNVPNFMSFFTAICRTEDLNSTTDLPERKSSFTQTSYYLEKEYSIGKHASRSRNSIVLPEIEEDMSDAENATRLARETQESLHRNYPPRQEHTPPHNRNVNLSKNFNENARINEKYTNVAKERNIPNFPPNLFGKENDCPKALLSKSVSNSQNSIKNHTPKKNQSFATLPTTSSTVFQQKRPLTGILSASGMIAAEINARGTPLAVKNMFEAIQSPAAFASKDNILKNIAKNGSTTSSSVILSDEECKDEECKDEECKDEEYKDELNDGDTYTEKNNLIENASFHFETYEGGFSGQCVTKSHPLKLNERDLNTRDKNFINSIGIFTEAGDLKMNAKKYLNKKEDVKKGIFRIPRVSQIHLAENYTKSYTSDSIFSDVASIQSSDIKSDD